MPDIWVDNDDDVRPTIQALRSLCVQGGDFQPCLPTLDEINPFAPYMDPIEGLPFDDLHEGSAYFVATAAAAEPATSTTPVKKDKPPPNPSTVNGRSALPNNWNQRCGLLAWDSAANGN